MHKCKIKTPPKLDFSKNHNRIVDHQIFFQTPTPPKCAPGPLFLNFLKKSVSRVVSRFVCSNRIGNRVVTIMLQSLSLAQ